MSGCHPNKDEKWHKELELTQDKIIRKLIKDLFEDNSINPYIEVIKHLNSKKEQYKKFHCAHCGKSTIIDVA